MYAKNRIIRKTLLAIYCRWEQHPAIVNAFYNPNTNDIGECAASFYARQHVLLRTS